MKRKFIFPIFVLLIAVFLSTMSVGAEDVYMETEDTVYKLASESVFVESGKEIHVHNYIPADETAEPKPEYSEPVYGTAVEITSENSTRFDGRIVENGEESCFNGIIMDHALDSTIEKFINEGWEYDPDNDVWFNGDKFVYIESDSRSSTVTE